LERSVAARSLKNVRLNRWLNHSDLKRSLSSAWAFVTPSFAETGGTALQEAMAMGMPVIATRWGGHIDRVPDGCGLLLDPPLPGSERAFVQRLVFAIEKITSDKEEALSMGRCARAFAKDKFLWSALAARVMDAALEIPNKRFDPARADVAKIGWK
jgi:glycosyltransferase involved in cell wall biosynthesis